MRHYLIDLFNFFSKFISLVRKHYPKSFPLYSIFSTKKLKIAYKNTSLMATIIKYHNRNIFSNIVVDKAIIGCNCQGGVASCLIDWQINDPWRICYLSMDKLIEYLRRDSMSINMSTILHPLLCQALFNCHTNLPSQLRNVSDCPLKRFCHPTPLFLPNAVTMHLRPFQLDEQRVPLPPEENHGLN